MAGGTSAGISRTWRRQGSTDVRGRTCYDPRALRACVRRALAMGCSVMSSASSLLDLLTPDPERVPWDELQVFDWVRALEGCPQDPIHHAEGNVWIHTRMVLETLLGLPEWRALPAEE